MDRYVYDSIGNPHERKNLYLKDLSENEKIDRKTHPYIIKLEKLQEEERVFLHQLKSKIYHERQELKGKYDKKELALRLELFEASKKMEFYEGKEYISYDFELEYRKNKLKEERLPSIIGLYSDSINEKKKILKELTNLDKSKNDIKVSEFNHKVAELKIILNKNKEKLKQSKKDGLISDKAYINQVKQLEMELKDKVEVLKLEIPSEAIKSRARVLTYLSKVEVEARYKIMYQDISDFDRKIPIEVEKVDKFKPLTSLILPGLGQYFNKQYFKSMLFFIGTLFIYFIAIPYALGYGNYRGDGLKGIITLAQGGKRLDKSIIFMVEGLVAVILMLFSIAIVAVSYKDARDVQLNMYKGIRPRTKFETIESVKEDGFPYIVTIITYILLSFVVILPVLTTILLSFAGMDPNNQSKFKWIGLKNYQLLITGTGIAGGPFWRIFLWTMIWTIAATTVAITVGFGLALIANNERIKGKTLYRTIYLLPWAVPAFITIMFFSIMSSSNGVLTKTLEMLFGGDWAIKQSTTLTRVALILLQTWLGSSYVFLLSTGVLQGIPADLYEAADIDGATVWQKLSKITIPLVLFQTAPLLIGQYTFNFNNFSIIYLFNGGGPFDPSKYGNMAGSTDLLISYIYKLTIQKQYQSVGAAITVFISLGLILFAYIGFKNSQAFKEEK
ncbi:MAG: ABC transporter permease subunit [Streptobacillus sp.]